MLKNDKYVSIESPVAPAGISKVIACVALVFWLFSLALVVFATPSSPEPNLIRGIEVLLTGWVATVTFYTIAWCANPLFLLTILRILGRRKTSPIGFAVLSVLVAMDTFRFAKAHVPSAGYMPDVYAYGWGCFMWFAALLLAVIASGVRHSELVNSDVRLKLLLKNPVVFGGTISLLLSTSFVLYRIVDDINGASQSDLRYLSSAPIKNGQVCKLKVAPAKTTHIIDGPLEFRGNTSFTTWVQLLALGVPTVRIGGTDFSLADKNDMNSVVVVSAKGPRSMLLSADGEFQRGLRASMISEKDGAVLFDQTWRGGGQTGLEICPDFDRYGDTTSAGQPGRLIVSALGGENVIKAPAQKGRRSFVEESMEHRISALVVPVQTTSKTVIQNNYGCPADSSLVKENQIPLAARNAGYVTGFQLGANIYLIGSDKEIGAVCSGDTVYLYKLWVQDGGVPLTIAIQARSISGFSPKWANAIEVKYRGTMLRADRSSTLQIDQIEEHDGELNIYITNAFSQESLKAVVPSRQ